MFFALNRHILMNLPESWTLSFTSCWIQTTFVYYMYVGQSLHRSSFHSAIHIASVTSLKKNVSMNYLRCFRQKVGLHHWARQSVRQKVQGRARRGTGSFELNPGLHELKQPTTRQTRRTTLTLHEISDCMCPVCLFSKKTCTSKSTNLVGAQVSKIPWLVSWVGPKFLKCLGWAFWGWPRFLKILGWALWGEPKYFEKFVLLGDLVFKQMDFLTVDGAPSIKFKAWSLTNGKFRAWILTNGKFRAWILTKGRSFVVSRRWWICTVGWEMESPLSMQARMHQQFSYSGIFQV